MFNPNKFVYNYQNNNNTSYNRPIRQQTHYQFQPQQHYQQQQYQQQNNQFQQNFVDLTQFLPADYILEKYG